MLFSTDEGSLHNKEYSEGLGGRGIWGFGIYPCELWCINFFFNPVQFALIFIPFQFFTK